MSSSIAGSSSDSSPHSVASPSRDRRGNNPATTILVFLFPTFAAAISLWNNRMNLPCMAMWWGGRSTKSVAYSAYCRLPLPHRIIWQTARKSSSPNPGLHKMSIRHYMTKHMEACMWTCCMCDLLHDACMCMCMRTRDACACAMQMQGYPYKRHSNVMCVSLHDDGFHDCIKILWQCPWRLLAMPMIASGLRLNCRWTGPPNKGANFSWKFSSTWRNSLQFRVM